MSEAQDKHRCPRCGRLIGVHANGTYRVHKVAPTDNSRTGWWNECRGSGASWRMIAHETPEAPDSRRLLP